MVRYLAILGASFPKSSGGQDHILLLPLPCGRYVSDFTAFLNARTCGHPWFVRGVLVFGSGSKI